MSRFANCAALAAIALVLASASLIGGAIMPARAEEKREITSPLDFRVQTINGKEADLAQYRGKAVLIVNVASKCGLTPQYEQLQALHAKYKDRGLAILGFPANNFMGQEPGTNEEIKSFCKENYGVEFDMFAKISVAGEDIAPLYAFLTSEEKNGQFAGPIKWNFTKFLVNREGKVVARFEPRTKPDEPAVIEAIEKTLSEPAPAS